MIKKKFFLKNCEICNSKSIKLFQKFGRIGSQYHYGKLNIYICLVCCHRFQNPRNSNQFFINYYLKNYRKKKNNNILISKKYLKSQETRGNEVYDYINKFFKKNSKKRILDHGSAMGHVMLKFKKNGWDCLGIDPNKDSIHTKHKIKSIQIDNYFGENLPKYKSSFDLIISLGSLEHCYDVSLTLKNIKKNLSINGIFFIRWRSEDLMGSPLEYFNFNHLRYFSAVSLKRILNIHGFRIIKETKKPIEFNDGYTYYVCKKTKTKKYYKKLNSIKTNSEDFINNYNLYLKKYYDICNEITKLKLSNKLKNLRQKKDL